jgi:hypothetical protein
VILGSNKPLIFSYFSLSELSHDIFCINYLKYSTVLNAYAAL